MPQMSPLWWTTLLMMFIVSYLIMMMMIYFFKIQENKNVYKNMKNKKQNINWKW